MAGTTSALSPCLIQGHWYLPKEISCIHLAPWVLCLVPQFLWPPSEMPLDHLALVASGVVFSGTIGL